MMGRLTNKPSRGMTLIELLVVVAIIGLLAVSVLPNVANTAETRRAREAARMMSTVIAKAQARAVGRDNWSGLMLKPSGPASYAALDVYVADVPPVYRGDTVDAALNVAIVGTLSNPTGTAVPSANALQTLMVQPALVPRVNSYDLIRFSGKGPLYEVTAAGTAGIGFRMRQWQTTGLTTGENSGQTEHNTPWPPTGPGVWLPFEIHCQPVAQASATSLGEGRVIDLRWSGCGPRSSGAASATYRRFTNLNFVPTSFNPYNPTDVTKDVGGATVTILFDSTGRIRQFLIGASGASGASRFTATGTVFLLVGRADRAGHEYEVLVPSDSSTGANWQYADSFWVAIDAMTGVTKTAECVPNPGSAGLTLQQQYDQLVESQRFVREKFD